MRTFDTLSRVLGVSASLGLCAFALYAAQSSSAAELWFKVNIVGVLYSQVAHQVYTIVPKVGGALWVVQGLVLMGSMVAGPYIAYHDTDMFTRWAILMICAWRVFYLMFM